MFQDLSFAFRSLRKRPAFSLVVIATLALGIGGNTAIFSIVNAVLLSPLPYGHPDRLTVLTTKNSQKNLTQQPVAYANFKDWAAQNRTFDQLAIVRAESFSLIDRGEPDRVAGIRVSTNILSLLGVKPILGRDFLPEEDQPGKATVALISYGLWQHRYAADPGLPGQTVTLEARPFTIIGVLPAWLRYPGLNTPPGGADVWIPFVPLASETNRSFSNIRTLGKLKPDVTLREAQSEMDVIARRLEQQYPNDNTNVGIEVTPLHEVLTGRVRSALWILLAAVGFVLLIACVNVANLLLTRTAGRRVETAIRTALGANRWRVMQQLMAECVVLSLSGGALGILIAYETLALLTQTSSTNIPRLEEIRIDGSVLAFTLLISLVTALLFGVVPALQAAKMDLVETLKEGRKGAGRVLNRKLFGFLAVTEIALALMLLIGAGLLIHSFEKISSVDPNFDPHGVLTLNIPLPPTSYPDQSTQYRYYENALARANSVPGVVEAAAVFRLPITGFATAIFTAQGQPVPVGSEPVADYRTISYNYLHTMRIRLVKGRDFTEHDTVDSPDVVIVNEALAERQWPNENPIGKRLQIALEKTRWREVVGVAANARLSALDANVDPALYVPLPQNSWPNALRTSFFVIRTNGDATNVTTAIRRELRQVDPTLPITQVRTMSDIIDQSLAQRRFSMTLLTVFAGVAGLLAAIGIYGVMSFNVAQRTGEMGIRLALGARETDVLRMVIAAGTKLTAAGLLAGLLGALGLTRLMTGLLFDVSPVDPAVYGATSILVVLTALLATYLPARRAAQANPIVTLKDG